MAAKRTLKLGETSAENLQAALLRGAKPALVGVAAPLPPRVGVPRPRRAVEGTDAVHTRGAGRVTVDLEDLPGELRPGRGVQQLVGGLVRKNWSQYSLVRSGYSDLQKEHFSWHFSYKIALLLLTSVSAYWIEFL